MLRTSTCLSRTGLKGGEDPWPVGLARALRSLAYSSPQAGAPHTPNPYLVIARQGWEPLSAQETMRPQKRRTLGDCARRREAGSWAPTRGLETGSDIARR